MTSKSYYRNCEPLNYLPQKIDLNAVREQYSEDLKVQQQKDNKNFFGNDKLPRTVLTHELIDSRIIPVFDKHSETTKDCLSLVRNEYMRQKYNRFLDNPNEDPVFVKLYSEMKAERPKPKPMTLTGGFYDARNRLAPIPYKPDPRLYDVEQTEN